MTDCGMCLWLEKEYGRHEICEKCQRTIDDIVEIKVRLDRCHLNLEQKEHLKEYLN